MSVNKSTILVDATMDVSGISEKSMKRVQKMIKENILTNNEINLEFGKNGQSAILKQLGVVYDEVNNIKKLAASISIGGTQYKMSIDDYSGRKKDVLKESKDIAAQEEKINVLKEKGRKTTVAEKAELKSLKETLKEMKEHREVLSKGLLKDTSIKGSDRYASSNLLTSRITGVSSSTNLVSDEKRYNDEIDKQTYLIRNIAKYKAAGAQISANAAAEELSDSKKISDALEEKIRNTQSLANAEQIVSKAKSKISTATSEASATSEISVVKERNVALNKYKLLLKEIEAEEKSLTNAQNKYNSSAVNQTNQAKEALEFRQQRIATLKADAETQKQTTNKKYVGEDSVANTKEYNEALKEHKKHLENVSSAQKDANAAYTKSNKMFGIMGENFKTAAARIVDYTLVYRSLWMVIQNVQKAVQTVIELNKAFTDIQMVTGYNETQINALEKSYSDLAQTMGATVTEVAQGATEWLRQGKSVAETNELLKQSMILSKTGAMDSATATEKLTSTLNGYKLSVEDASKVVDVFSKLDMITASSAGELAEAFTKTANSAHDAGIPFENLAGLIATVSETTRKSASTIGESYKTLAARYMNIKVGKFVDDETGEAINDTEKVLNKLGIQLRTSQNEWRDMWDVMNEVGSKWDTYTDAEQNAIVVAQAGVRQAENMRATYANWNKVLKYTAEAYDSAGFAAKKYQVYLDSIEGRMNKMTATFQDMVSTPEFENFIKTVISIATAFGKAINSAGLLEVAIGLIAVKALYLGKFPLLIINSIIPALTGATVASAGLATAINMIAPVAVVAGIIGLIKLFDHWTTTLKEQTDKVNTLVASLESLNSEYDTLKSKTILTESENKRLTLLEKEIKLTELLTKKEKERQAAMIISDFTKSNSGGSAQSYGVDDSNLGRTNAALKKYKETQEEIKKINADILTESSPEEYDKLINKREELNNELSNSQDELGKTYQALQPLLESETKLPPEIGRVIQGLESALGIAVDYSSEIERVTANQNALEVASIKLADSQSLTKKEADDLIEQYPQLESAMSETSNGFIFEKSVIDDLSASVGELGVNYSSAQSMMNEILNTSSAQRLGILSDELMSISSVAEAYALFAGKGGGSGLTEKESRMGLFLSDEDKALKDKLESFGVIQQKIKDKEAELLSGSGKSGYTSTDSGSSSSSSAIDSQDMAKAFIKAANAQYGLLKLQQKSIEKQIERANNEKDYAKQIELENQLLVNQKLQVLEILNANEKIHEEADRLRSNSKYSEASKGWFDMNGEATSTYINLLESYAGKTDKVSKAQYEAITTLYDSLYKLKNGWYDNVDAIDTLNSSMLDVVQNIQNIKEKQLTAVNDAQDIMTDYLTEYYNKVKDEEQKKHDKIISNIDKEISALEKKYDLEDYNKDIAEQDKTILEKQAEMDALALDNSSEAMAKKATLQQELDDLLLTKDETVETQKRDNAKATLEDLKDLEDERYTKISDNLDDESSDIEMFNKTRLELENSTTEEIMSKYEELGATIGGVYDSATQKAKLFAAVSSGKTVVDDEDSAYNSSGSSKPNYVLVNSKGVSNAKEGDIVVTGSGLWQKNADGVASTYIGGLPNVDGGKTSDYSKVVEAYNQLKAYKNGGLVDSTGIVQLDGTKSNPEYVLNSADFASLLKVMDMTKMIIPGIDASSSSSSGSSGSANIYPEVNIYSVANENVNSLVDKVKAEVWNDFDKKLNLAGIKYKRL